MARRKNPSRRAIVIGTTVLGLGALVTGVALAMRKRPKKKKAAGTGEPPARGEVPSEGTGEPIPQEPLPYPTPVGTVCEMGPKYPGYVVDGDRCVPGPTTPRGYYVHSDCTDFDFAQGPPGGSAQTQKHTALMKKAAKISHRTAKRLGQVDPTAVAAEYLATFWPECQWPPDPGSSDRIVQLFEALTVQFGRLIYANGGTILGTKNHNDIDTKIFARLSALGLPPFDPGMVPEVVLPSSPAD